MRLWLRKFTRRGHCPEYLYFESSQQFRRTLERERMRADRNAAVFSLIEYEFGPGVPFDWPARQLEHLLKSRLRSTDVAGLTSENRIGVLLTDTPASGARTVVRDIASLWAPTGVRLQSKVSVYSSGDSDHGETPDDDFDLRPDPPRERSNRRIPAATATYTTVPHSETATAEVLLFVEPLPTWKRSLDVMGASVGGILLAPLVMLVIGLVWLTSGRPIFFRQRRSGLGGRPFWIYKFRTMCPDAELRQAALREFSEQDGPAFKLQADPRLTRLGRYLRKSSIDELPQLWNVLKGEMTLVGPRPLPCAESDGCAAWQLRRLEVTPGLTCIWQVEGKSRVTFAEWMRMDLRYIQRRTPWHDFKLIMRTMLAVVTHRASY